MSITIPSGIEKDIKCGRARYQTYQTGMGGQSVLVIPDNSYIIIFGYDFSPAGGGFIEKADNTDQPPKLNPSLIRPFETQQISFYTGQAFHPFIHHVDCRRSGEDSETALFNDVYEINNQPIVRSTYIISNRSVAITVGLINRVQLNAAAAIPVTDKTPGFLTYGGSAATPNVESVFSSNVANPPSQVQPSLKQFQDYGLGGVPGNAQDQAFAVPDQVDGLIEPSQYLLDTFGLEFREAAAANYFLNVHYALYTQQEPESLG